MKQLKTLTISLIFLTLISGTICAKSVNKQEAEDTVKGWLKADAKPLNAALGQQILQTDVYNGVDGNPVYYVVYLDPSGFVIMPADDLVEPVVCFVTGDAYYDPSPENPLGAMISRDLPGRVDVARKIQAKMDAAQKNLTDEEIMRQSEAIKVKGKWNKLQKDAGPGTLTGLSGISDIRVAPLTQSRWGQSTVCSANCYNYYTPGNSVCGCVATAMSQYMRYQEWPAAGIGLHTFTIYVNSVSQNANTRGGDGSGGPYNWTQMTLVPGCGITDAQRQAIGALCYDAGVAAHMQYSSGSSGAYMHDAKSALVNTFMYSNAIMGGNEYSDIGSGLNGMINPNLDAGDPVLLGVYKSGVGGHAIVADGYGYTSGTLYHHINMGWNGYYDAWYNLPNIDSSPAFNIVDSCIYNIYTSGHGEIISGRVTDGSGQPIGGATVTAQGPGGPYTVSTNGNGIYAFAYVASSSTYAVSVTASSYFFTSQNVTTGKSSDGQTTSGNRWGIDFTAATTPPQPPQAPGSISYPSSSNSGQYTVSWASSTGATLYQLDRSSNGGGTWSQVYSGANVSYNENVGNGNYRYRVSATNTGGSSDWTTGTLDCVVNIPPPPPPAPAPPTNVSATDGTYFDKVTVSWSASAGADSYEVWRGASNKSNRASRIASNVTSLFYDDKQATAGTTYWYWVKAVNAAGTSGFSSGNSGFRAKVQPPSPPTGVSATDGTYTTEVQITWTASVNATSYEIWRGTRNKSSSATKIGEIASSPYDDMSAAAGKTYWYWVKAKDPNGTSGFSNSDSGYKAK